MEIQVETPQQPWFMLDKQGRHVPTPEFIEHTLVVVARITGWRTLSEASLSLTGARSGVGLMKSRRSTPSSITTVRLAGSIDGWFPGYDTKAAHGIIETMDPIALAWEMFQSGRSIPAMTRKKKKKRLWTEKMRTIPQPLPSDDGRGANRKGITRELSQYVLKSTAHVLFPRSTWQQQRLPLAQLLGVRLKTIELWRKGYAVNRGLMFKALALRILDANGNLRMKRRENGDPDWRSHDWEPSGDMGRRFTAAVPTKRAEGSDGRNANALRTATR